MVLIYRGSERLTSCRFGGFLRGFWDKKMPSMRMVAGVASDLSFIVALRHLGLEKC